MRSFGSPILCCLSLLGAVLMGQPAEAASVTLRVMLWGPQAESPRRPDAPPVARYHPEHGDDFILDRSTPTPLLRFEDSQEVWVLQPQPGPRGDTIYRNDIGQPVLRATKLGGLTLFTVDNPDGAAAALGGEAGTLRPAPFMSPNLLFQRMYQASARASRAAQRVIPFLAIDDATPETATLLADTATVTAEAITKVSHQANGKIMLTRVVKVMLARGRKPDATLNQGALTVIYAPEVGMLGRPSSERIVRLIVK
ncbi:MAG: DUF4908 domain-containing protein [Caulobacteraceae bacterium]|nr:DUF4908 domain-containing protein [Caulobacteraceae bacterium]